MANLAQLGATAPLNRALESLAGSDALFSRVGGLNGDPAAVALSALPPLDMAGLPEIGDGVPSLPVVGALPGVTDGAGVSDLLSATSLAGGLPLGGLPAGGVGSIVGGLIGAPAPGETTLGSVGDLLHGEDPAAAVTNAVETGAATVEHLGSGALAVTHALGSGLENPLPETLNNAIDGLHLGIEFAAHTSGLSQSLHGVTNLGQTVGLGEIGGENLVTDALELPAAVLHGNVQESIEAVTGHLGNVLEAAPNVVTGLVTDIEVALGGGGGGNLIENVAGVLNGGDPIGGVGNVVGSVGETVAPALGGVVGAVGELGTVVGGVPSAALNNAFGELNAGLESAGAAAGLPATVHGVVDLGETVGLGTIGGENLISDVRDLVNGADPADTLGNVVDHAAAVVPAVVGVAEGVVTDLEGGLGSLIEAGPGGTLPGTVTGVLQGGDPLEGAATAVGQTGEIVGHLGEGVIGAVGVLEGAGSANPVDTLNGVVDELHEGIELASHTTGLTHAIHGVTHVGETVGLGQIGGENLVTDVVDAVGAVGGEPAPSLGGVVEHAAAVVPAAQTIVDGLTTDVGLVTAGLGGGSLPLPAPTGGADGLVGALEETVHAPAGGLPEPVASIASGGLDLDGLGGLGDMTDLGGIHLPTPQHHGGLGLV